MLNEQTSVYSERLKRLKELNKQFLEPAHEVTYELCYRNKKNPYSYQQVIDLYNPDISKKRMDRSAINKDASYLLILDVENHKTGLGSGLKKCLEYVRKIQDKHNFFGKFSGRGFHLIAKIESNDETIQFLLDNNIDRVCDFANGIVRGIIQELSIPEEYIDFNIYTSDSSIRGLTCNAKVKIKGKQVFSVPIFSSDDINKVLKRSILDADIGIDKIEIPIFPVSKYNLYIKPPDTYKRNSSGKIWKPNLDYNDFDSGFDIFNSVYYKRSATCVRRLIDLSKEGKYSFYERKVLLMVINAMPMSDKKKLGVLFNLMGDEGYNHFKAEGNLQFFMGRDFKISKCSTILNKNMCPFSKLVRGDKCDCYMESIFDEEYFRIIGLQ